MRAVFLIFVASIAVAAFGQGPGEVRAKWMLDARSKLSDAGILRVFDHMGHRRPITRYELAVEVHAATDHLQQLAFSKSLTPRDIDLLKRAKPHIPVLRRLAQELKRELVSMDVPFDASHRAYGALSDRLDVVQMQAKVFRPGEGPAWILDAVREIKEAGLLVGYPEGKHSYRGQTNYEMAVAIHAAWDYFGKIWDASSARNRVVAEAAPGDPAATESRKSLIEDWKEMRRFSPELAKLKRLATAFKPELAELGVDVPRFMSLFPRFEKYCATYVPPQVGSRHGPFPDVPPSHWAEGAVDTLRKAGILVGYPDYKFRG